MYVENETICQDGEKWREAFDGVYEGDGYFLHSGRGEDVPTKLKKRKWKGCCNNVASWRANAMP